MFKCHYSIKKSFSILNEGVSWYKTNQTKVEPKIKDNIENLLHFLQEAILKKERKQADLLARELELFLKPRYKKSPIKNFIEFLIAICIAFFIATLIRQLWFELYQIPTGSMRPTYRELDHLIVSKTAFGINIPFDTGSLYFDPSAVQRGSAVIFSSSELHLSNTDSRYFWLFPYKKRFIKRMIGLPGDALYFYGGQLYGVDSAGNDLDLLRMHHEMQTLEYVSFRNFLGEINKKKTNQPSFDFLTTFSLAGNEIGRGKFSSGHFFDPEINIEGNWVKEGTNGRYYEQFYGLGNYGMARLLDKQDLAGMYKEKKQEAADLYLEIRHDPNLQEFPPQIVSGPKYGGFLVPSAKISLVPLGTEEINNLWNAMYTTRFEIKNEVARAYAYGSSQANSEDGVSFPGVPDGTYEFYYGKGYSVNWGGHLDDLPANHPLYERSTKNLKNLFNLGIEFSTYLEPKAPLQAFQPSRYAYFRNGDLFVMGQKIIDKGKGSAKIKALNATGFIDQGPPLLPNGKMDSERIRKYGLHVPEKHYFVLGDNHAVSADGRVFGFVPEHNLEGVPTLIIWPFGERWGFASHHHYPWITLSNLLVWGIAALGGLLYWLYGRYRISRRIF